MDNSTRPRPDLAEDRARWEEQSLRHRILSGEWAMDAEMALREYFSEESLDSLPEADTGRNPALSIYSQIAAPHGEAVEVSTAAGDDLSVMRLDLVWPLMTLEDIYCAGMGESVRRLDATERGTSARLVSPASVVTVPDPKDPIRPVVLEELRWRDKVGEQPAGWTWERWDISDPAAPAFTILDAKRTDVTAAYLGEAAGKWPDEFRFSDDTPFLPYVIRHALPGLGMWDWRRGSEVYRGTLRVSAMWTWWVMLARDTSSPQRVLIDGQIMQEGTDGGPKAGPAVRLNPLQIARIRSDAGVPGGAKLDAWDARTSPMDYALALREYEAPLATFAGLTPADVTHGQASSGYAIVVSREGQRRAQRRFIPGARMADQEMLAKMAAIGNRVHAWGLPESPDDYAVSYGLVGRSPAEVDAEVESAMKEVAAGYRHPADIVQIRRPHLSRSEAIAELIEAARDRSLITSLSQAAPTASPEEARALLSMLREAIARGEGVDDVLADVAEMMGADDDTAEEPDAIEDPDDSDDSAPMTEESPDEV